MELFDSHTHLETFARSGELPEVLGRARQAGLVGLITIGTEPADWSLYHTIATEHPGWVHYTVGLHPCSVDEKWPEAVAALEGWRDVHPAPVAIGETGLDRFHLPKKDARAADRIFAWQKEAFRAQIALARAWGRPLVVHSRGAAAECLALLDEAGAEWPRVVFHCFADGPEVLAELQRRGGHASFTGIATYKNAENVRRAARAQGLARLMIETDAPYLTPEPLRGQRNEPAFVAHTAVALARVLEVEPDVLAAVCTANTRAFFRV